jgi:hypothetical protein
VNSQTIKKEEKTHYAATCTPLQKKKRKTRRGTSAGIVNRVAHKICMIPAIGRDGKKKRERKRERDKNPRQLHNAVLPSRSGVMMMM